MTSWAGIESGSASRATASQPLSDSLSDALSRSSAPVGTGANVQRTARGGRRLRRQQRPIIGSLDAAGVMIQRHAREFVFGSAILILPGVVLNLIGTSLAFDRYQSFKKSVISIPELLGGQKSATGIEQLLAYLGLLVNSMTACLVGGFVATLVVRSRMGAPVTLRAGYQGLARRAPALLVAWVIGHCWVALVALGLEHVTGSAIAPLVILGSPLVAVFVAFTVLVSPVIVIERTGPFGGLRRSLRMGRTSFGAVFAFVVGSSFVGVVVQYGIAYLPRLMQFTGLVAFGRFGWLIEGVAGQLGRLISTPLIAAATACLYLELRMKMEGMDLMLDADRVFGARTEPAATHGVPA